ncbi:MAG: hypothetical protein LUG95_04070 [Clostridiales bacterium]|nr:hypothetical protein [Clostridiales bacterium]
MKSGVKKKQDKYFRTAKEKNEISYAQSDAFHLQKINTPEEDEAEKRKLNQIHIGV